MALEPIVPHRMLPDEPVPRPLRLVRRGLAGRLRRPHLQTRPPPTTSSRGGTIYDGSGGAPFTGDVAIEGDRIAFVGRPGSVRGEREIDARGLAVAPGFINMLSWATEPDRRTAAARATSARA